MTKRLFIVIGVAVALLVLAVPAMAWNGLREDYTTNEACKACHDGVAGIPDTYTGWSETKHGENEAYEEIKDRAVNGSVCQGCHTSNFDPAKAIPTPTATTTAVAPAPAATNVLWGVDQSEVGTLQAVGNAPWSENMIGCSSCHYGANVSGGLADYGVDANNTAHMVPLGEMANADICGACHSRYSYTVDTFSVTPIPYVRLDGAGDPIPNPSPTSLIQPQMALGYPMLGSPAPSPATGWDPAAPLSDYLNIPAAGWSPTPDPAATSAGYGRLSTFWNVDGVEQKWQQVTHELASGQYPEWANEGHADALTGLTSQPFWGFLPEETKQECLECHSTDYVILEEAGKNPTSADVKYGVTCVGCHAPHEAGTIEGAWSEHAKAQLIDDASLEGDGSNLCTKCHNGEIPEGTTASPGTEIHHPMKEMIDGYGAIDVSSFPSVHKGKCIECHMPPTYWQRGSVQDGANHTFDIIEPKDAVEASPVPVTTAAATATATPVPGGTPVVTVTSRVTWDTMPYSACSTCHNGNTNPSPKAIATATATPNPTASPLRVNVTIDQMADGAQIYASSTNVWSPGGDRALWMQDTIDQRQEWTKAKIAAIWAVLDAVAVDNGYADAGAARDALVGQPANTWTTTVRAFLSSFTNVEFVESEGSFGLHNWDYSREIVNTAMMQAKIAESGVLVKLPWKVTFKFSKSTVNAGAKVTFSGTVKTAKGVAGVGTVKIMKRVGGVWKVWQRTSLKADGSYKLTKKMTAKGSFWMRATMPADSLNKAGTSTPNKKLVVK